MAVVAAGARITGSFGFEEFGAGLAGGDFNGDGIADLAVNYRRIGDTRADSISTIQIIYGGEDVFEGELAAADLSGGTITTSGVTDIGVGIDVPGPLTFSDVNGDGLEDLLIGAPRAQSGDPGTGGAAYILFGIEGEVPFSFGLTNLTNGTDGQVFFSTGGLNAGSSIIDLGDVDGDGTNELFIGVPFAPAPGGSASSGLGYVIERDDDAATDLAGAFADPPSPDAAVLFSSERTFLGEDAAALGDVNGDGVSDFLVTGSGAIGAGTGPFSGNNGEAYLIYGQQGGLPDRIDVAALDGTVGTKLIATDIFQIANRAEATGDVNGDGFGDFFLMDAGPATDEPLIYLVYGSDGGLGATFDISTSDGVSKLGGVPSAQNSLGVDMAGIGDINGDGFDDVLASRAAGGPNGTGEIALLFGSADGLGDQVDLDEISLGAGYVFTTAPNEFGAGFAVTGPGDLNGDGVNDIVIGAPFFNPESNAEFEFDAPGAAFVIFGGADRLAALDALSGVDGIIALADVDGDIEIPGDDPLTIYSLGPDFTISEQNGANRTFAVTVTRSNDEGAAEIALAISGDATIASGDFARIGGSNVFADGETETTILYRLADDMQEEPSEDIIFDLSLVSSDQPGIVGDGQQVVTVEDDDAPTAFSLSPDFRVFEDNGVDVTFSTFITRSSDKGAAEVGLTFSGTATSRDFSRIGGSTSFADGETSKAVIFRVTDDTIDEVAETLILNLSVLSSDQPTQIDDGQQVITIIDDDEPAVYDLGADITVTERNGQSTTFAVTVTRSDATGMAEIALTPSGTATAFGPGADFARIGGSNIFANGETEKVIIFRLADDVAQEPVEEIRFDLSLVSADAPGVVGDGQQIVRINDDDTRVNFTISPDITVFEQNGVGVGFTTFVTRSSGIGEAVVNIGLGGTATSFGPARDYQLLNTPVTFADGETSKAVNVSLVDDAIDEVDETIVLGLIVVSSTGTAVVADGTQIITIRDDDEPPAPAPIIGDGGDNRLTGGALDDRLSGRGGDDTLVGGRGDDFLRGGLGSDRLFAGAGDDTLDGGAGGDLLVGGSGDDRILGRSGADNLIGADGADRLSGGGGSDLLNGGAGRDLIFGGTGNDTLKGEGGADFLVGSEGADRLEGGAGADLLFGGEGRDTLFGGGGDDSLEGGEDGDFMQGQRGDDTLDGEAGDDFLFGDSGADLLLGRGGRDFLRGDSGDDRLSGGSGDDRLFGGTGNDRMIGGAGDDELTGGDGDDRISGGSGDDRLFGEEGRDTLSGGTGDDFIRGGTDRDLLSGSSGRDLLSGEGGSDFLTGGSGADTIRGGTGQDLIIGGDGNDMLIGGGGRDTFVFDLADGADRIRDFRNGTDRIEISEGPDNFADLQIFGSSTGATIRFGQTEVALDNVNVSQLDGSDFIFS
ncbi:MAG: Calx-beta domain-containing protein [Pseudomonadota bacterium]